MSKKFRSVVAVSLLATMLLASCGGNTDTGSGSENTSGSNSATETTGDVYKRQEFKG